MITADSDSRMLDEVRSLFRDALGLDPGVQIDRDTRFFADLGLASIDAVVLGEAIQNRFTQQVPFAQLLADLGRRDERDLVIGELIDFLMVHTGAGSGPVATS